MSSFYSKNSLIITLSKTIASLPKYFEVKVSVMAEVEDLELMELVESKNGIQGSVPAPSGNKAMSKSRVQKPRFQSILKSSCG